MTHALARWSRAEERLKRIEAAADELAEVAQVLLNEDFLTAGNTPQRYYQKVGQALAAYRKAQQET